MTKDKFPPNRMRKYEPDILSHIQNVMGIVGSGIGRYMDNSSLTAIALAFTGFSLFCQGLVYVGGYFNERLEIENQKLKQNKLEKEVEQK